MLAPRDIVGVSEKGHEHPWLAGDICPEVPRVAGREQRVSSDHVDVVDPIALGLLFGFDYSKAVAAHVVDAVADPVDVLFYRHNHVGEN